MALTATFTRMFRRNLTLILRSRWLPCTIGKVSSCALKVPRTLSVRGSQSTPDDGFPDIEARVRILPCALHPPVMHGRAVGLTGHLEGLPQQLMEIGERRVQSRSVRRAV